MSEPHRWSREQAPPRADAAAEPPVTLRPPDVEDGAAIWSLVRGSTLDENSPYAYLMLARYYASTCAVAERQGRLTGFVSAFIPPEQARTLFVWQIGVHPSARGCGLATRLIADVLARPVCRDVRYVEATVTPSNAASLSLFRGFAEKLGAPCRERTAFHAGLFPAGDHEEERLLRIGPCGPDALRRVASQSTA